MEENKKPSNPIAFPQDANTCIDEFRGMTLRDYFAAKAMQAILSQPNIGEVLKRQFGETEMNETDDIIARTGYRLADAMLKQR